MKRNFRVVRVTYKNGKTLYYVQRECKHLRKHIFFGNKLWKTYDDVYDGNYSSHTAWRFFVSHGTPFSCEEDARREIRTLEVATGWKIKSCEVV